MTDNADYGARRQRPVCSGSGLPASAIRGHAPCPVCGEPTMPVTQDGRLFRHRDMRQPLPPRRRSGDAVTDGSER